MPERTSYAPGTPSWVDLATSDQAASTAFYSELFGWESREEPAGEQGTYTMFAKNGKDVAALMQQSPDEASQGIPPHWNTYITVEDVEASAARASDAGGTVIVPPLDVMGSGRMAGVQDPTGAMFSLWEPRTHIGAGLVNEPGTLSWNELLTDDVATAQKFYAELFDWGAETQDMPNGPYTSFKVGDAYVAGMMAKTEEMGPIPNYWGVYFAVDDCDDCVTRAEDLDGRTPAPAFDVPEVGRIGVLQDPRGAVFSVLEPAQPPQ